MKGLFFLLFSLIYFHVDAQNLWLFTKNNTDSLFIENWSKSNMIRIYIGDLDLNDSLINLSDLKDHFVSEKSNFRILLLEKGFAKLKNIQATSEIEKQAQNKAQNNKLGIWKEPEIITNDSIRPEPKPETLTKDDEWINIKDWDWKFIITTLLSLLGIGFVSNYIHKLFKRKKLKLLIIGEPSVGKTALYSTLIDRNVDPQKLLNLSKTIRNSGIKKGECITFGSKFDIYPQFSDYIGSDYKFLAEQLIEKVNVFSRKILAVVIVLAPVLNNNAEKSSTTWKMRPKLSENDIDRSFLDEQFGVLKMCIGLLRAKSIIKKSPRVVITFINKFDIFSDHDSTDSSSAAAREFIEDAFEKHYTFLDQEARAGNIKWHKIIGSTTKKWGIETIWKDVNTELKNY